MSEQLASLLELGAFALCAVVAWRGLRLLLAAWHMRRGTFIASRKRVPDEPLPPELSDIERQICGLGFIPQRRVELGFRVGGQPQTVWCYHHPELHIELALVVMRAAPPFFISLETAFADGALLVASYPRGATVESSRVQMRFAENSLYEAFDHHLLTQLQWTETHGDPQPVSDDDATYFRDGAALMAAHGRALYGPNIRLHAGQGVGHFGLALLLFYFVVSLRPAALQAGFLLPQTAAMLTLLLVSILLIAGGFGYSTGKSKSVAVDAARPRTVDPTMHPLQRPERTT